MDESDIAPRPSRLHHRPTPMLAPLLATGPMVRRVRLVSGLVLFSYVALHLTDHALGNAGIAAMDAMLVVQKWLWQGVVGTTLLYGAAVIHAGLGLWSLYARRYVGWTKLEILQLLLGLSVPPLLANHLTVTRLTLTLFGNDKAYPQELHALWLVSPFWGTVQLTVLVVAWTHACIGLGRLAWLARWYERRRPLLLLGAVLLPVLAMLGFAQGVRQEARHEAAFGWHPPPHRVEDPEQAAELRLIRDWSLAGWGGLVLAVLAARLLRRWHETGVRGIAVSYPQGQVARIPVGLSVLDASRMIGVPHASFCGGRGRCSTCRVRVVAPAEHLPAPSPAERRVLEWVGVDPALVRLACQLRPLGDVAAFPLVPPEAAGEYVAGRSQRVAGEERFVAALFVDMRDSTLLAATQIPYDSVFLVGRFVSVAAEAVVEAGGAVNQFTGDGLFALFGLDDRTKRKTCLAALDAVARLRRALAALSRQAAAESGQPIRYGIGLHCGLAIVGEIGFGGHATLTALGDVVNVASRLQAMTREFGVSTIVSETVFQTAGVAAPPAELRRVEVRGRTAPLDVRFD